MAGFTLHPERFDRDRLISAVGVAAVHALLAWALLTGLGVRPQQLIDIPLSAFDLAAEKPVPPPPPEEQERRAPRREGRAAPANLPSRATPVAAPTPDVVTFIPPPLPAAPIPAIGNDLSSGNADRPGPGTGSGGAGDGTGSGGDGNGPGGGGGGRPARLVKRGLGSLSCDTPEVGCPSREVGIRFTVGTNGRATGCAVTASSGDHRTDAETCRRIEQKLRYEPARDPAGRKIAQVITGSQFWDSVVAEQDEPDPKD